MQTTGNGRTTDAPHDKHAKQAVLYRRVIPNNTCVHGHKALALLRRGYRVEDRHLTSGEAIDAAKLEFNVATFPQAFIAGEQVGGYTDLLAHFGRPVPDPKAGPTRR